MGHVSKKVRIIESNTTLREGRGNPVRVAKICNPRRRLPNRGLQILDTRMGFPSPSLNVVIDYFSHSCLKMCKTCLKCTLCATFADCLALTYCNIIGELLPEWACLTLQGGTFLLTSKLADIPVSIVRKSPSIIYLWKYWYDVISFFFRSGESQQTRSNGEKKLDA